MPIHRLHQHDLVVMKLPLRLQLGHDGVTEGSGWFVREVEVDMPTKGKHYSFACDSWLARDKGDGQTTRLFTLDEANAAVVSYKPRTPHFITLTRALVRSTVMSMSGL